MGYEPPTAAAATTGAGGARTLADVEREHILRVLESCGWRVRGPVSKLPVPGRLLGPTATGDGQGRASPGRLFPRVGFIVTTLTGTDRAVVHFYNQRGTAEQWIKEGKEATRWTRLSCPSPSRAGR